MTFAYFHQLPSSNSISQPFQANLQNQSSTSSSSNNIHSQHYQQTYANQQPTVRINELLSCIFCLLIRIRNYNEFFKK